MGDWFWRACDATLAQVNGDLRGLPGLRAPAPNVPSGHNPTVQLHAANGCIEASRTLAVVLID